MLTTSPWAGVIVMFLVLASAAVGVLVLLAVDALRDYYARRHLDQCLTCRHVLTWHPHSGTYSPHRCRPRL